MEEEEEERGGGGGGGGRGGGGSGGTGNIIYNKQTQISCQVMQLMQSRKQNEVN